MEVKYAMTWARAGAGSAGAGGSGRWSEEGPGGGRRREAGARARERDNGAEAEAEAAAGVAVEAALACLLLSAARSFASTSLCSWSARPACWWAEALTVEAVQRAVDCGSKKKSS
jgi:hypothetical protein